MRVIIACTKPLSTGKFAVSGSRRQHGAVAAVITFIRVITVITVTRVSFISSVRVTRVIIISLGS